MTIDVVLDDNLQKEMRPLRENVLTVEALAILVNRIGIDPERASENRHHTRLETKKPWPGRDHVL